MLVGFPLFPSWNKGGDREVKFDFKSQKRNPSNAYSANMAVEFLEVIRRDPSGLDKSVKFKNKFVPGDFISIRTS
jgi:hypothetical protein